MGNTIGQQVDPWVDEAIKFRQKVFGAGYNSKSLNRSPEVQQYLNNRSSWIKLASGVSLGIPKAAIDASTTDNDVNFTQGQIQESLDDAKTKLKGILSDEGFFGNLSPTEINSLLDQNLAQSFILFNGTQKLNTSATNKIDNNNITQTSPAKYTKRSGTRLSNSNLVNNFSNLYGGIGGSSKGLQPSPGILDVKIDCINRGSIRKATVNIKAFNKLQFSILEILYLRLGYLMLLEYGWDKFINNVSDTVEGDVDIRPVEDTVIDTNWFEGKNYSSKQLYSLINQNRLRYKGCYDGFLGKVTNFEWKLNVDNTYDITLKLVTIGSVVESLNVKQPIVNQTQRQLDATLKAIRLKANENLGIEVEEDDDDENIPDDNLLNSLGSDRLSFYLLSTIANFPVGNKNYVYLPGLLFGGKKASTKTRRNSTAQASAQYQYLKQIPEKRQHYVRFGTLLEKIDSVCNYIVKNGDGDKEKMITFDLESSSTRCAYMQNLIPLSPQKVIFSFSLDGDYSNEESSKVQKYFENAMYPFASEAPDNKDVKFGLLLNTYFNLYFVAETFKSSANNKGEVLLYKFLEKLCNAINESTGNITAIEPVLRDDNVLYFIDQNPIIGGDKAFNKEKNKLSNPTKFQIYGYSPEGESNFVKSFDFKTKITPDLATQITIGATSAGSDTKNMDAFPLRNWNKGLINKFEANLLSDKSALNDGENDPIKLFEKDVKKVFSEQIKNGGAFTNVRTGGYWKTWGPNRGYSLNYQDIVVVGIVHDGISYWDSRAEHAEDEKLLNLGVQLWSNAKRAALNQANDQSDNDIVTESYLASRNYLNYIVQAFGGDTGLSTISSALIIQNAGQKAKFLGLTIGEYRNKVKVENVVVSAKDSLYFTMDDNSDFLDRGKNAFRLYQQRKSQFNYEVANVVSSTNGFIPLDLGLTFDGLSGIKIYNKMEIDTKFLPSSYPKALKFITTKVDHTIKDNQWETSVNTLSVPVTNEVLKEVKSKGRTVKVDDGRPLVSEINPVPGEGDFIIIDNRSTAGVPVDPNTYGNSITIEQFGSYFNVSARSFFINFANEMAANYNGYTMYVNAIFRTFRRSVELKRKNPKNADPGKSLHNYALAFDANIVNPKGIMYRKSSRGPWINDGIPLVAKNAGLVWGGDFAGYVDCVHFGYEVSRNTLLSNAEIDNAPKPQEDWDTKNTSIIPGEGSNSIKNFDYQSRFATTTISPPRNTLRGGDTVTVTINYNNGAGLVATGIGTTLINKVRRNQSALIDSAIRSATLKAKGEITQQLGT